MSRIQQLPAEIRERLDCLLRTGVSQRAILDQLAPLLQDAGEPPISRSALNRYATRMEAVGQRIRSAREAADAWTARFGEPSSELDTLVIDLVRTLSFETSLQLSEGEQSVEPETLAQLALVAQRITRAAKLTDDRIRAIRVELAAQAADEAERAAREATTQTGHVLPPEALRAIREQVYGIVDA